GLISSFFALILLTGLTFCLAPGAKGAPPDVQAKRSPLLAALQAELERSMKALSAQDPPAYYLGYTITDTQRVDVSGSNGALLNSSENRNRWLEVSVRTGSYNLDDTHKVGGRQMQEGSPVVAVPVDDDPDVLRRAVWLETDKEYRAAEEALIKIKTGKEVKVETAEGNAPDFSREQPHTYIGPQVSIAVDPTDTPDDKAVYAAEATLRKELEGLVAPPINDPSVGPALLTGRAAAVFFHEVFGHRAEGHRQKDVTEGQTFSKKVGEQILPDFLSITDDTTMKKLGGEALRGYYQFEDEGVPARRVTLVDHGVLKNFEMSRSALVGFPHSNGHGRRQLGATPVSRQGNLIVQSSKT